MPALADGYSGIVCDLDGVVYRGPEAVPHAPEILAALRVPVVFATNNASRRPEDVAAHLRELGVEARDDQVLTSSMAGAREVERLVGAGARVLAVGGPGVAAALRSAGLAVVEPRDRAERCVAVLQGYGWDVTAGDLAEAAYAVEAGAAWVVTNDDLTLPTDRGVAPGNGTLVRAVAAATGATPAVVGKPHPPLYLLGCEVLGSAPETTLGVGDRLETDVAGAVAAGMDSVLVLTGVHGLRDAALAPRDRRPTYVVRDLRALGEEYEPARTDGGWWTCGDATVRIDRGGWEQRGGSAGPADVGDAAGDPAAMRLGRAMVAAVQGALDAGNVDDAAAGDLAEVLRPRQ